MEVAGGAGFELGYEAQVEVPGLRSLGVDEQTAAPDP